ncbi:MAG: helix-turn-helix domain-containing protein [Myxococcota bacterium]
MPPPRPGQRVRGSRTGRPVMALLDLLGRRWTLRVLWELRDGPRSFRGLRSACDDISPSTLNARLTELRDAGLIVLEEPEGYALTDQAMDLCKLLLPLDGWARRWGKRLPTNGS